MVLNEPVCAHARFLVELLRHSLQSLQPHELLAQRHLAGMLCSLEVAVSEGGGGYNIVLHYYTTTLLHHYTTTPLLHYYTTTLLHYYTNLSESRGEQGAGGGEGDEDVILAGCRKLGLGALRANLTVLIILHI